jgi:hypothetical protein
MVKSTKGEAPAQRVARPNPKHIRGDVRRTDWVTDTAENKTRETGFKRRFSARQVIWVPGFGGYPVGQSPN